MLLCSILIPGSEPPAAASFPPHSPGHPPLSSGRTSALQPTFEAPSLGTSLTQRPLASSFPTVHGLSTGLWQWTCRLFAPKTTGEARIAALWHAGFGAPFADADAGDLPWSGGAGTCLLNAF
uniref:Uncharacterized protein n=1 Tax=Knipowitschia caucasica TaxID=637954 RepID=A0AAV2L1W8_KNICA